MNEYNDDDFNHVIQGYDQAPYQQPASPTHGQGPYGIPPNSIPAKPGLTKRGKVGIAVCAALLATGGLIFWQHSNAVEAANQAKQQEYALESKKLDLQMLQAMNQANSANAKQQSTAEQERQKQISACVNADKGLVGKQMGVNYSSVLRDCRAQYPASVDGSDMQNAASASNTSSGSGGASPYVLAGIGALGLGVVVAAKKGTRSNAA